MQLKPKTAEEISRKFKSPKKMLLFCARVGSLEGVKFALNNGANINDRNGYRETALMIAYCFNQEAVVKFLLENGANPRYKNRFGANIFSVALQCNRPLSLIEIIAPYVSKKSVMYVYIQQTLYRHGSKIKI